MYFNKKCTMQEQDELVHFLECTFCLIVEGKRAVRPARLSALREEILNISDYDLGYTARQSVGGLEGFLSSYQ